MKIIRFTDANKDFRAVLDTVNNGTDAVVINRQKDNDPVVMSSAHYNCSLQWFDGDAVFIKVIC